MSRKDLIKLLPAALLFFFVTIYVIEKTPYLPRVKIALHELYTLGENFIYNRWLIANMKDELPKVHEAMAKFLKEKHGLDFVVEPPKIERQCGSYVFYAAAHPKENPKIKFRINSEYYCFADKNFEPGHEYNFFYDRFAYAILAFRKEELEKNLKKFYKIHQTSFTLSFIKGSDDEFKRLNLVELTKSKNESNFSDLLFAFHIYSNNSFNKEQEAQKISEILTQHFSSCKTGRYIILIWFLTESGKAKFGGGYSHKNSLTQVEEAIGDDYSKGYLNNACILFGFESQAKEISKQKMIDSFLY